MSEPYDATRLGRLLSDVGPPDGAQLRSAMSAFFDELDAVLTTLQLDLHTAKRQVSAVALAVHDNDGRRAGKGVEQLDDLLDNLRNSARQLASLRGHPPEPLSAEFILPARSAK